MGSPDITYPTLGVYHATHDDLPDKDQSTPDIPNLRWRPQELRNVTASNHQESHKAAQADISIIVNSTDSLFRNK